MRRIIILLATGCLVLGGWAYAREQEMLQRYADLKMKEMEDGSCPPSSNPSGGQ